MKTTTLLGVLGFATVLLTAGCTTTGRRDGYLVYYDVGDAGAIWCWENHYGWRYLGENEVCFTEHHRPIAVHRPGDDHKHPKPGDDGKHHGPGDDDKHHGPGDDHHAPGDGHERPGDGHRRPPAPGEKPPPNSCYLFFGKDGTVLNSRDGSKFNSVGQLSDKGDFVRHETPTVFHGTYDGRGNSFAVAPTSTEPSHGWLGNFARGNDGSREGRGFSSGASGSSAQHDGNRWGSERADHSGTWTQHSGSWNNRGSSGSSSWGSGSGHFTNSSHSDGGYSSSHTSSSGSSYSGGSGGYSGGSSGYSGGGGYSGGSDNSSGSSSSSGFSGGGAESSFSSGGASSGGGSSGGSGGEVRTAREN